MLSARDRMVMRVIPRGRLVEPVEEPIPNPRSPELNFVGCVARCRCGVGLNLMVVTENVRASRRTRTGSRVRRVGATTLAEHEC